jgi:hypothetical protein
MEKYPNTASGKMIGLQPSLSLFHFDALLDSVVFEDHIDSFNDFFVWISFAMDYDLVLKGFGSVNKHHMLLAKAIVPTAVPHGKIIRVFLERVY